MGYRSLADRSEEEPSADQHRGEFPSEADLFAEFVFGDGSFRSKTMIGATAEIVERSLVTYGAGGQRDIPNDDDRMIYTSR